MSEGIVGTELHQAAINLQALSVTTLERQEFAHQAKYIDIIGDSFQNAGEKLQLKVDLSVFRAFTGRLAGDGGARVLIGMLAQVCHDAPLAAGCDIEEDR